MSHRSTPTIAGLGHGQRQRVFRNYELISGTATSSARPRTRTPSSCSRTISGNTTRAPAEWGDGKAFLRMPMNVYFSSGYGRGQQAGRYGLEEAVCRTILITGNYRIWKGRCKCLWSHFRHSGSGQTLVLGSQRLGRNGPGRIVLAESRMNNSISVAQMEARPPSR